MGVKEGVFGAGQLPLGTWTDADNADKDGFYWRPCNLGDSCETHKIDGDDLIFTSSIEQLGNDRTRSITTKNKQIKLGDALTINTSPFGVDVDFVCTYKTTVTVASDDFTVQDVTIAGSTSSTGTLDQGFTLTVGDGTKIILGQMVTATAKWEVTLSDIAPHFRLCILHHGGKEVVIIKDGCISATLGMTDLTPASDSVSVSFRTFTIDSAQPTTAQRLQCHIRLCPDGTNCAKAHVCPKDDDDHHYGYF
jgi:hypothetical protein